MSIVKNYLDQPAYERLTIETYKEFVNLELTRKPYRGEDVYTTLDYNDFSADAKIELNKLPIVVLDEKWTDGFFSDMLDGKQQFYILISEDMEETYFVDTQGYKYARYVSFIENLPETFFIDKVA
jgi:hypothetical protein